MISTRRNSHNDPGRSIYWNRRLKRHVSDLKPAEEATYGFRPEEEETSEHVLRRARGVGNAEIPNTSDGEQIHRGASIETTRFLKIGKLL